ncbi:MAG: hypothetical protein HKN26_07395 [Acidimicrobiales bacterium]|nr:hypothetical protein [Acidimicrobiales bacterium]
MTTSTRGPAPPAMPHPLVGAFGRPVWNELRAPVERKNLRRSTVWADAEGLDGRGRPVVVVTGYLGTPDSVADLTDWLERGGYAVTVADMERNRRSSTWAAQRIAETIAERSEAVGRPVTLIGHSRGGQQCRVVANRSPEGLAQLITLGSPIRRHLPRQIALRLSIEALRLASRLGIGAADDVDADRAYQSELFRAYDTSVPWTAIWSKTDGIVEWQACFDPAATNVEITASHLGLTGSIASFRAIAAALREATP